MSRERTNWTHREKGGREEERRQGERERQRVREKTRREEREERGSLRERVERPGRNRTTPLKADHCQPENKRLTSHHPHPPTFRSKCQNDDAKIAKSSHHADLRSFPLRK